MDLAVHQVALIPWEVVKVRSVFVKHTNAWNFMFTDEIWAPPGVEDIIIEATQERRRIVPAAEVGSGYDSNHDAKNRTRFDLVGATVARWGLGKGRLMLALAHELVHRGVSPEKLEAKLPWARNFLWRSADGIRNTRAFAIAVVGDGIERFFTADADLVHHYRPGTIAASSLNSLRSQRCRRSPAPKTVGGHRGTIAPAAPT